MIRAEHLTKSFGDFTAVDNVSFEINEGETFALLGPNGSGKTTTLKCLVGLITPSAGRVTVCGNDLRRNPREASVAERAAAFDSFFAYTCRWRVVGDSVEHAVALSHNPALVGTVQVRRIQMRGRQLTLSAIEPVANGQRVHRLQWRPAGPAWVASRRRKVGSAA